MDRALSTYQISSPNGIEIQGTVESSLMNLQDLPDLTSGVVQFKLNEGPGTIFQFIRGSTAIPESTNITYSIKFTLDLYIPYDSSTIHKTQEINTTFQVSNSHST
ncbi:MAG: hypothetical protein LBD63_01535 [Mycoplasmataceae bacterium]|jgi:hypothetical protein|nr:hypothetical protein [Mycoplasmataceae bacterium]